MVVASIANSVLGFVFFLWFVRERRGKKGAVIHSRKNKNTKNGLYV
jgi:hypothetical protein